MRGGQPDRVMPHNLEAEMSVLGACLLDVAAYGLAARLVTATDFFRLGHQLLFRAMRSLDAGGVEIDLVTVKNELSEKELDDAGGPAYIAKLIDGVPRSTNVEHYARIVKEDADRRNLIIVANGMSARAYEGELAAGVINVSAQEQLATLQTAGTVTLPTFEALRTRLARPQQLTKWRIRDIQPTNTRAMLVAQFKAGKTNFVGNVVRSLVDHDAFLGLYEVAPINGVVTVLDTEMGASQLDDWYRVQQIHNDDRVLVVPMRGRVAEFNILDPRIRKAWADLFRTSHTAYLVVDCVRPVLDALGLDEHREAGRFLVALDTLMAEAGVPEGLVVQHMGHTGERARGDSRFRDWPDVEWQLVRKTEDPSSSRFFKAYGRDVDVPEGQLSFDTSTRRLTWIGGSRAKAKTGAVVAAVQDYLVTQSQPPSGRAIKSALASHPKHQIDDALKQGRESGALIAEAGPRTALLYRPGASSVPLSRSVPHTSRDGEIQCPAAFIRRDAGHRNQDHANQSSVPKGNDAGRF